MTFFTLILTALADDKVTDTLWLPPSVSTLAEGVDETFYFVYWVSMVFFVALMGTMFYFAVAYKKKSDVDKTLDLKGSHTIELIWSVFPSFLLFAMFAMGFTNYMESTLPPADALQVKVKAQKWKWTFQYPTLGTFSTSELVVPNKEPVRLQMVSVDVLHSFFVPDFRIKKDVIPNRYTALWFETTKFYIDENVAMPNFGDYTDFEAFSDDPDSLKEKGISDILGTTGAANTLASVAEQCKKEKAIDSSFECEVDPAKIPYGLHQIYCTEYCGDHHSRMLSKAVVLEPSDFELWAKSKSTELPYGGVTDPIERGAFVAKQCKGCHSIDGSKLVGPTWKGTFGTERDLADGSKVKMDDNYIIESIRTPGAKLVKGFPNGMTPFGADSLSEDDITYLIEYMKTLK